MSEEDNIRVAEEYLEAYNAHDYTRMSEHHGEGFQAIAPGMPGPLDSTAYQVYCEGIWTAFPDLTLEESRRVVEGDCGAGVWTMTGTHTGPLAASTGDTLPATGHKVTLAGCDVFEFDDGKLARVTSYFDRVTLYTQMGVAPGS